MQWITPVPLWENKGNQGADTLHRPAILRFATDTFMDDFMTLLETNPGRMKEFIARFETWRGPSLTPAIDSFDKLPAYAKRLTRARMALRGQAGTSSQVSASDSGQSSLKLYQPAHQRFYLVAACLVERSACLSDRAVDAGSQERAVFVMRRVVSGSALAGEYAFVNGAWQKVEKPESTLASGEEELPLSPVTYIGDDSHQRRLWTAMIPVGRRETYVGAPLAASSVSTPGTNAEKPIDPREGLLRSQVIAPWKNLINNAYYLQRKIAQSWSDAQADSDADLEEVEELVEQLILSERNRIQEASWYLLLDLADFLESEFGDDFWTMLAVPNQSQQPYKALQQTKLTWTPVTEHPKVTVATSLSDALIQIRKQKTKLEGATKSYVGCGPRPSDSDDAEAWDAEITSMWPDFIFPLVDVDQNRSPALAIAQPPGELDPLLSCSEAAEALKGLTDGLMKTILDALPASTSTSLPPVPLIAQKPMSVGTDDLFVIRCVFRRPNCGPLQPPVISERTVEFRLAAFFDPDAPARPIRIALPVDTTPAGLRKFDKNTAFIISDVLCGQIERAKGLGLADLVLSVLPWPFHKDLSVPDGGPCANSFGMICSLSIPIITICALILLMIIVSLLDMIFRWLPYFIVCLPFPKFDAKSGSQTP